jgi:hypothetical protein
MRHVMDIFVLENIFNECIRIYLNEYEMVQCYHKHIIFFSNNIENLKIFWFQVGML